MCLIGGFVIIIIDTVCITAIVVVVNDPTKAKVSDYNGAIFFNETVVGLEVTMNDVQAVEVLQGSGDVFGITNA